MEALEREARLEPVGNKLLPLIHTQHAERVRHQQAVRRAVEHLEASLHLSLGNQTELVAEEFRSATSALSRILGHVDIEDVLDHIFSNFCIGK